MARRLLPRSPRRSAISPTILSRAPRAFVAFSALAAAIAPPSASETAGPLAGFALRADAAGTAVLALSELAVRRASDERVRAMAKRFVADHERSNAELREAARADGIALPAATGPRRRSGETLSEKPAAGFDWMYLDAVIEDHEAMAADYEKALPAEGAPAVRIYAEKTLPMIREHLRMARGLRRDLESPAR